jgi:hypothetical protein
VTEAAAAEPFDLVRFAEAYQALASAVARLAPGMASPFEALLREHLGQETSSLPVVSMAVPTFDVLLDLTQAQQSLTSRLLGGPPPGA